VLANIIPKKGCFVPIALWSITAADERKLDVYEGFLRLYRKEYLRLKWGGRYVRAMVYIMNHGKAGIPSKGYFNTIWDGYTDFGIDPEPLFKALWESQRKQQSQP